MKLKQNSLRKRNNLPSLNNVHEPRNAEFTAFLGSFFVAWQSNDNNIEKLDFGDGLQELVQSFLLL